MILLATPYKTYSNEYNDVFEITSYTIMGAILLFACYFAIGGTI